MPEHLDDPTLQQKAADCEQALQYQFRDQGLLRRCLTHASVARTRLASNERLEFLGDSILGAVVCEMLFHAFPQEPEGELTRLKSALVSRTTCASISRRLGIDGCLLLGKGLRTHKRIPMSIMAAVFESLIAGVYLDGGRDAAGKLIQRVMQVELERLTERDHLCNYKSQLQQFAQKNNGETPVYRLLDEKGPDHSKCFEVAAVVGSRVFSSAWGPNKKEAEQRAAANAMADIEERELPFGADV